MLTAILMTFSMALILPQDTQACMCYPAHPQQAFCWSDFVVRAGVLSDQIVPKPDQSASKGFNWFFPTLAYYEIVVTKVFKGSNKIKKLLGILNSTSNDLPQRRYKMKVHTAQSAGLCGVSLKKGKKYLLTGYVYAGKLNIGLCNWIRPFRQLSKMEHRGIRGEFDCSCSTAPCWGGGLENCPSSNDKCYWDLNGESEYDSCTLKHRMCLRRKNKCTWSKEGPYDACRSSKASQAKFILP